MLSLIESDHEKCNKCKRQCGSVVAVGGLKPNKPEILLISINIKIVLM